MEKIKNTARATINRLGRFFGTDMMYIVKGGFWMNASYVFVSLVGLATSILFARFLSKADYGMYQYVLSIAALVSALTLTGMNSSVTRAVSRGFEGELVRTTKYQLWLGIIPTTAAGITAIWYALHGQSGIALALVFVALFLPPANALNTWGAYVSGKKDFPRGFYYGFFNTIISYSGVIILLIFTRNFIWVAFGNFFFGLVGNFIIYFWTIKVFRPSANVDKETVSYGNHLSLMNIPGAIAAQLDSILVFHFVGAAALAVYSFATLFPEKLAGGLKFVSGVALPRFSEKNEQSVNNFLKRQIWWILGSIGAIALAYALIAPYLFVWLFPNYMASVPYTQVYAFSFFSVAGGILQIALTSQKKTKELYQLSFVIPAIKALLLLVFLFYFGVWGIIWAQIITNFVSIIFVWKIIASKKSTEKITNL